MSDFFQLICLGAALTNLALTIFLLSREFRSPLNRVYFLWGISISVWNLGVFFMFRVTNDTEALFWARFLHFGVIFLPVSLLHLALMVAQIKVGRWIYAIYGLQGFFAIANFTDSFISGVRKFHEAYYSEAGILYWPFLLVYSLCASLTLVLLYRKQKTVFPLHRVRLHSLMMAAAILIVFGINDIAPIFGQVNYPGTNTPIYPLGSLAAIFYSLIVSYSILQHQLLDIHVTLGKVAAYGVRFLFLFLIGFALLLTATLIVDGFTTNTVFASLGVLVLSGVLASVLFPRLFGRGSDTLERRILGDRFEYHDRIQGFIRAIPWYSDTSLLLRDFNELLVNTVKLKSYQIILNDELHGKYSVFHSHPAFVPGQPTFLPMDAVIFDVFRNLKLSYLPLNPAYAVAIDGGLSGRAREELKPFAGEFCFPMKAQEEPFGILILGSKLGSEHFTANDLYLFDLLIKSLASVMNQIRLKNKVLKAEEQELLGRMSRGMAHDLNNLLTPISTFLQLCLANRNENEMPEGLLPIAARNVATIRDYIQEALFFSQTQTPHFRLCRLDLLVEQVVQSLHEQLRRKQIQVRVKIPAETSLEMDEVLIQRLVSNLISNAIDASQPGGEITIETDRSRGPRQNEDWLELRVVDSGSGITRENLKRVLKPYFTTKIHGDETRGVGLGLAISEKIAQLHSGNITIVSEENRGTTVQVYFPWHQPKEKPLPMQVNE